jgi:hypothetical protein
MSGRGIVSVIGLCLLLAAQGRLPGQDAEMLGTVVHGVQARTVAITSLSGRALVAVTHSARCVEERSDRLIEEALNDERDPLPADPIHASMVDFSFDVERRQWRCEMVDLTNSGWVSWATSLSAVEDRKHRPDGSYRISLSDGKRVYTYARHDNAGWVQDHDPAHPRTPEPIGAIRLRILEGYSAKLIKDVERGDCVATYGGEEDIEGNRCMCLSVQGSRQLGLWARAWVAPTLGFATVRHEEVHYKAPASDAERLTLLSALVSRASDFAEVATGVWCPQYIQLDRFDYTKGEGLDAWESSTTVDCLELRANTGVEGIAAPYLFPFDAEIRDGSNEPIRQRPRHRGLKEVHPDAFGTNLAPDDIVPVQGTG